MDIRPVDVFSRAIRSASPVSFKSRRGCGAIEVGVAADTRRKSWRTRSTHNI